ncbi:MAG: LytTR family DNA-binding domain-containing protein [Bacteroidia bacterium]|nr:LytTR family DNA-binding domain-containing protein [Bacteroidia bacterium]
MMKIIQRISIWDYVLLSGGFFLFFTLMRPYGLENSVSDNLWALQSLGCCVLIFVGAMIAEIIVTYLLRLPSDYSKEWPYQIRRKVIFYLFLVVLISAFAGQYFTIIEWGWKKWYYFWIDPDGHFSLKWFTNSLVQNLIWMLFVAIYWYFATKSRMKEYRIQELLSLNEAIEQVETVDEGQTGTVDITGEYKESISVSPADILYIESVANYLNIHYFQDGELKQKRIRNTLKSVEETLGDYPFLLHCHRAFLVNTRFITHVEGNSAGCQLHLFSMDRTIPVSKANIEALRQALQKEGEKQINF